MRYAIHSLTALALLALTTNAQERHLKKLGALTRELDELHLEHEAVTKKFHEQQEAGHEVEAAKLAKKREMMELRITNLRHELVALAAKVRLSADDAQDFSRAVVTALDRYRVQRPQKKEPEPAPPPPEEPPYKDELATLAARLRDLHTRARAARKELNAHNKLHPNGSDRGKRLGKKTHDLEVKVQETVRDLVGLTRKYELTRDKRSELGRKIQQVLYSVMPPPRRETPPPSVVIFQFNPWPAAGQCEWVVLKNIADTATPISGWTLTNGRSLFLKLPRDTAALEPGQTMVLILATADDPAGKAARELADRYYRWPEYVGDALGNRGGQLGLYSAKWKNLESGPPMHAHLRSYIAWGWTPADMAEHADGPIAALAHQSFSWCIAGGGKYPFEQGARITLAGEQHTSWRSVCDSYISVTPKEIENPKGPASWRPLVDAPPDGGRANREGFGYRCWAGPPGAKFIFQTATSEDFADVLETSPPSGRRYSVRQDIPDSVKVVYWRVRAVLLDGSKTNWTKPRKLKLRRY